MPGLAGIITRMPPQQARAELERMVRAIHHESFYVSGTWADESLGIYVGWVSRRGSFSEAMPVSNERGDVTLMFSGEDYPEPDAVRRLREKGHVLDSEGPAYLVHLYEEDPQFLRGLNGVFQGLVVDRRNASATLFNDRYGMHRLYYHESGDAFYFSAEAKAIVAARPATRTLDPQGLGEMVSMGCVLENRTLFESIKIVPAAAAWTFRGGSLKSKAAYFQPAEWESQEALDPESYYRELREVFSRNLPRYFSGQEPVGIALTGGLDTRVIMAWRTAAPRSLPCYTFGGTLRDSNDVRIARNVASLCQQSHEAITVGEEFLSRFPHYAERTVHLTEGCVGVANSPDLYISEQARQIAPAKVVGTWGSEILRQAVTFKPTPPAPGLFRPDFLAHVTRAEDTYATVRRAHPTTFTTFQQTQWYQYGIEALEQTQLSIRPPYLANDFVRTVYRAPKAMDADVRLRLIRDGNPALAQLSSDRGVSATSGRVKAAAEGFFQEFTFKAEYAYDYGMPQWLARVDRLLSPLHLDRLFLGRHKFLHFRIWYRDRLSEYVRQILLDPLTLSRPYLQPRVVETMVREHIRGDRNHTSTIHRLLTMELLQRMFA